ncbi:MAG: nucleoside permease [Sedimentisphaerales bacterium]|nr:nucleoside permease [Sedimentisphaerales bacterium]
MTSKTRIQLSIMMFFQFFVWGAWFVPMWRYLSELKFSGLEIGNAYSTTGWAAILSPFFVGMIADKFFPGERVLGVLHLLGGAALWWASTVTAPGAFFWVLLLYALCYMPTLALVNAVSFHQMDDPGQEFPGIRVLGTIGWIVAGLAVGWFVPKVITGGESIEATHWPMRIAAVVSLALGVFCFFLPHTPPKAKGEKVRVKDILGLDALGLMRNPSFAVFIVASFLVCIPLAFYYQSANGFLGEIGLPNPMAKMTFGQMSEIFFMLVMPFFFARLGVKYMLLIGMLAWVARYAFFAFGDTGSLTALLYLGILLHGVCYDFFFVTGQIYVDKKAPTQIRANAQGFIAFVTLGVGMVIGNLINGWVTGHYEQTAIDGAVTHNWKAIWLIPAAMAAVVALLFAIFFREKNVAQPAQEDPAVK